MSKKKYALVIFVLQETKNFNLLDKKHTPKRLTYMNRN